MKPVINKSLLEGAYAMDCNILAPLVLFVYNRPEHLKINLENLNDLKEAKFTHLFVFSDAPRNDTDIGLVNEVRNFLERFKDVESNFDEVTIIKAEKNKGLADSIIGGVSQIIEKYGKVIVLEDDLFVASDFLNYMNRALDYYEMESHIWAISGYSFWFRELNNYPYDVFLTGRACSWGWATWKDRWETVDWAVKDYDTNIKSNVKNRIKFGEWGRDMPFMLDANIYGLNHSWAIRWCYEAFKQNKLTVYPKYSRVMSNGTDGTGTNYKKSVRKYDTELFSGSYECKFLNISVDKGIKRGFRRKYMNFLGVIRAHFKMVPYKRKRK